MKGVTEARGPPYLGFQRFQCKAADGSILVVRIFGGLMNLDAFFAFSAMRVRFAQVTDRAFRSAAARGVVRCVRAQALRRCRRCARGAAHHAYGAVQYRPDAQTTYGARV
jgi:hypothetical protein